MLFHACRLLPRQIRAPFLRRQLSVSKGSLESRTNSLFEKIDSNKDGLLSRDEVCASAAKLEMTEDEANALFTILDVNGDGKIDRAEFKSVERSSADLDMLSLKGIAEFFSSQKQSLPKQPVGRWSLDDKYESAGIKPVRQTASETLRLETALQNYFYYSLQQLSHARAKRFPKTATGIHRYTITARSHACDVLQVPQARVRVRRILRTVENDVPPCPSSQAPAGGHFDHTSVRADSFDKYNCLN